MIHPSMVGIGTMASLCSVNEPIRWVSVEVNRCGSAFWFLAF